MSGELDIYSNSRCRLFLNINDMFGNLMDLRHEDDLFNYFLHEMRYFNNSLSGVANRYDFILHSMNFFEFSLNFIVHIVFSYEFIFFNYNVFVDRHLLYLFNNLSFFDYFLFDCRHFHYFLLDSVCVHNFVNKFIDNFVASNEDWLFGCDFNKLRHLHCFLDNLLDLINFGHLVDN